MKLYDTLSRNIKEIQKNPGDHITLYTCGPTVYDHTHLGHIRKYVMDDILKRTLQLNGYKVKHVMNITDVGHLTGDDDTGEDKLEKKAKTYSDVMQLTRVYTDEFVRTMKAVNIILPEFSKDETFPENGLMVRATNSIHEMIDLIKKLEEKGYVYETEEAVYFDTTKFSKYGELSGQRLDEKKTAARESVITDPGKKHPTDFALWFLRKGRFAEHILHWESPWGEGFPGWHIECSAMSMKYLGETIDIHTGGIDHIPVHHENEIAQSEATTGKQFVKIWVHHAFLHIDSAKMSKSKGNYLTLNDVIEKGYEPLVLRYLMLQTHYRKELAFSWEALNGAKISYNKLKEHAQKIKNNVDTEVNTGDDSNEQLKIFEDVISTDLNIPNALAIIWNTIKSDLSNKAKYYILEKADLIFGLNLFDYTQVEIPSEVMNLAKERFSLKQQGDYSASDVLRNEVVAMGYEIEDTSDNYIIRKK